MSVTAPPRPPDQGDPVSREELEALVQALIEEARQRARRRRRRNAAIVTLVALAGVVLFALLGTGGAESGPAVASGTPHAGASPPKAALPEELSFNANGSVVLLRRDGRRLPFLSGILQPRGDQRHLYTGLEWSPDGSKLLALRWGYGVRALEVTDETGKVVWTVADRYAFDGRWSPDGTRIAFIHVQPTPTRFVHPEPGLDHVLFVASRDGRPRTRIAANVREFSWSPDGTKLAYAACAKPCGPTRAQGAHRLAIADATGRGPPHPVPLPAGTGAPGRTLTDVQWSPHGSLIAFLSHDDVGTHLNVVHPDGSSLRRLADGDLFPFLRFEWSPDGKRLAIVVPAGPPATDSAVANGEAGPRSADVSVVNADGTDLHRIARCRCDLRGLDPGFYESVAWSLDGTRVAYISGRGNTVSTIRPDGTGATVVATQAARGVAGGPSGYWYPSFPLWRPSR